MKNKKHYLVLKDTGYCKRFDGEYLSQEQFNEYMKKDFEYLSKKALENNQEILIIEFTRPIIRLIPKIDIIK